MTIFMSSCNYKLSIHAVSDYHEQIQYVFSRYLFASSCNHKLSIYRVSDIHEEIQHVFFKSPFVMSYNQKQSICVVSDFYKQIQNSFSRSIFVSICNYKLRIFHFHEQFHQGFSSPSFFKNLFNKLVNHCFWLHFFFVSPFRLFRVYLN